MRVFISGKVTGLPRDQVKRNFERGKSLLLNNTYDFISPLDLVPEGATNREAMAILLPVLASENCDGILLLNDSKFSEGSQIELKVAQYCGLNIYFEDDFI